MLLVQKWNSPEIYGSPQKYKNGCTHFPEIRPCSTLFFRFFYAEFTPLVQFFSANPCLENQSMEPFPFPPDGAVSQKS
jgi:hypothetical protein